MILSAPSLEESQDNQLRQLLRMETGEETQTRDSNQRDLLPHKPLTSGIVF